MANIYLRVPTYLAQFYRGRDDNHVLAEHEPIKFSAFQHEAVLLSSSLVLIPENNQTSSSCYSQRAWKNMLSGRPPQGGDKLLIRDPKEWITINEICLLIGENNLKRMEGMDYLCIALPNEVLIGNTVRKVNGSYSLPPSDASELLRLLRNEFIHLLLDWIIQERRFCNQNGIKREISTVLEHFFSRYRIQIGADKKERNIMRRMAYRWVEMAQMLPNDRVEFNDEDMTFINSAENVCKELLGLNLLK